MDLQKKLVLYPMTPTKAILFAVVSATCVGVLYYTYFFKDRTHKATAWDDILKDTMERLLRSEHSQLHDILMLLGHELISSGACRDLNLQHRLYIVTATYPLPEQIAELTRMSQMLMHVKNMHWLVIEDADNKTQLVSELLQRSGISHEHLTAPMPKEYTHMNSCKPVGVSNRLRGLQWIRANATSGVLYFADSDHTYDLQLFEGEISQGSDSSEFLLPTLHPRRSVYSEVSVDLARLHVIGCREQQAYWLRNFRFFLTGHFMCMRTTKRVSMWPVGLCTKLGVSSPIVVNGSLIDFYDGSKKDKKFPVDLTGFAVNVEFLLQRPNATIPFIQCFEEDGFLKSLAPLEPGDLELKAKDCTEILVWHTETKKNGHYVAAVDLQQHKHTNLEILYHQYGVMTNNLTSKK